MPRIAIYGWRPTVCELSRFVAGAGQGDTVGAANGRAAPLKRKFGRGWLEYDVMWVVLGCLPTIKSRPF